MKKVFYEQLPYIKGAPFSWEYLPARKENKYRIRDCQDDPVGSADTQEEAIELTLEFNEGKYV